MNAFHNKTYTMKEINEVLHDAMNSLKVIVELILVAEPQEPIKFTLPFPEADFYYKLHKVQRERYAYIHIQKYSTKDDSELGTLTSITIIDEADALTDTLYHIQVDAITTLLAYDVEKVVRQSNFRKQDALFV